MATLHDVGRDLYYLGLVTSHGGNLSIRDRHELWITGTGTMLGRLEPRHIAHVRADGSHSGPTPSRDTVLHSTVYALGEAQAVVHAHPRHAIALSFGVEAFKPSDVEGRIYIPHVPVIADDAQQTAMTATALKTYPVALIRGHGAYARGSTLWEALHWITALEESATIELLRRS